MQATVVDPAWVETLKDFTRRNAGRATRLEIDDPDFGAQWEAIRLRLRGAAYDPRGGRVELMLEDGEGVAAHLTHSIEGVTAVDVLRGADGTDRTLRIAHPGGQALLTLVDAPLEGAP